MNDVAILKCHQAADWVRRISRKFESLGAVILVGSEFENLCRRMRDEERAHFGSFGWVVESQGLPNLIHELVHALYLGRLDDDHGFDYGEIPLDPSRREHRAWLWEELACCGLSATSCAPLFADPDFEAAWFMEQFEIQGVFHGLEDDLPAFRAYIDGLLATPSHRAELDRTLARGHAMLAQVLVADTGFKLPDCAIHRLWQDYRARADLPHTPD